MLILNDKQIAQKIKRLAFEIIEQNTDTQELCLAGINNNGFRFAQLLKEELQRMDQCVFSVEMARVTINPAQPITDEISLDVSVDSLQNKAIILVDDVANTGRTLFYAFNPFLTILIQRLQVAVLVDRKHKSYPVHVDFVGLSLATTMKEHVEINLTQKGSYSARII